MTKLQLLNKIADYIRVNGSNAPIGLCDIIHLLPRPSKLDQVNEINKVKDMTIMLNFLADIELIEDSYSEKKKQVQFLWIGGK